MSAPRSRARRTAAAVSGQPVGHDAEVDHSQPSRARQRHGGVAVGIDDLAEARVASPASPARRRSRAPRALGARCTGTAGWFMAAASARSRSVRRRPLREQDGAAAKSSPAMRTCLPLPALAGDDHDRSALARGVLLDHDRVGARRHDAAGEDARGFARRRPCPSNGWPAATSPTSLSRAGTLATSAARTA